MSKSYWTSKTTRKLATEIVKHLIEKDKTEFEISLPKSLPITRLVELNETLEPFNVMVSYNQLYSERTHDLKIDRNTLLIDLRTPMGNW